MDIITSGSGLSRAEPLSAEPEIDKILEDRAHALNKLHNVSHILD